jgi:hypothetical protein
MVEMETQVLIAHNLGYLSEVAMDQLMKTSGQVSRLLHGLMQSLQPAETRN